MDAHNQSMTTCPELNSVCLDIKTSLVINENNEVHQKTEDTKVDNYVNINSVSSSHKLNNKSSSHTTVYLDCSDDDDHHEKTNVTIENTLYESVYEDDVSERTVYESFSESSLYFSTVDKTVTMSKEERDETRKPGILKNKSSSKNRNPENSSKQICDPKFNNVPVIEGLTDAVVNALKTGMWNTCITLLEEKLDHSHLAFKQLQMVKTSLNERTGILYIACELGCEELISVFIMNGFHVNRVIHHYSGSTMLHVAALSRHVDLVKYLLLCGASPNAEDKWKYTPLHLAALLNRFETVKLLVRGGAKIGVRNAYGNTPLHEAALCGSELIVQFLLDNNSNTGLLNKNGKTAEDVARIGRFDSVADLLSFVRG